MNGYKRIDYKYTPQEKREYWEVGKGLQAVDGLKTSQYLEDLAKDEIADKISLHEVEDALQEYYRLDKFREGDSREADLAAVKITEYLRESEFSLNPLKLKQIHRFLFYDIPGFAAGEYRTFNIQKEEPVLLGLSVKYEDYREIPDLVEYDMKAEARKQGERSIDDISDFIAGLWKTHPFAEGNTRTIAVFTIQYLNYLGYRTDNTPFAENAKYFRDALVRASYSDMMNRVYPERLYLNRFFENTIMNKSYMLKSEDLVVKKLIRRNLSSKTDKEYQEKWKELKGEREEKFNRER